MPDPEMVSRAHRAAVTLERAWERWRIMHGLSAQPMPPVSSYVGYSIEEPWGRPRVVFGVDAHEAEMLAALLDRHECVGPFYQPEPVPTQRSRTPDAGEPPAGGTGTDSALRAQIPAQAGPVEEMPGPVGAPGAPAGPVPGTLTGEDTPAHPGDNPVEEDQDWRGAAASEPGEPGAVPMAAPGEPDAAPMAAPGEPDAVPAAGRGGWGGVPAVPAQASRPPGDGGGGPRADVWEPASASDLAESAPGEASPGEAGPGEASPAEASPAEASPAEASPAGSDPAQVGAEQVSSPDERVPGGLGAPEWPGPDRHDPQHPRFRDPARPRHRRSRPDSQSRTHQAAQPGAGPEAPPRRARSGWPGDAPGAGARLGEPGADPYAQPPAEGRAGSARHDPAGYGRDGEPAGAETTTEEVAGWAAGELPGRATARLAARASVTGWPEMGYGESGAHGAAAAPSIR